jgi:hypothetical protein
MVKRAKAQLMSVEIGHIRPDRKDRKDKKMKKTLILILLTTVGLACNTTRSQVMTGNQNTQNTNSLPTSASNKQSAINAIVNAFPKPTPYATPIGISTPIYDKDYIVTKIDETTLKKSTLGKQPLDIILRAAQVEPDEQKRMKWARSMITLHQDWDFNQDGVNERFIIPRGPTGELRVFLYIFQKEGDKWKRIFLGDGDESDLPEIEFLRNPNVKGYDLIKTSIVYEDKNVIKKEIYYYQMQNDEYKLVECHFAKNDYEQAVPCGEVASYYYK